MHTYERGSVVFETTLREIHCNSHLRKKYKNKTVHLESINLIFKNITPFVKQLFNRLQARGAIGAAGEI